MCLPARKRAERGAILRMVMRRGVVLLTIGIVLGFADAAGLTRYLWARLYDVTPLDPATYVTAWDQFGTRTAQTPGKAGE